MSAGAKLLVFTDLDGSLLDHDDYGWGPAAPLLARLEQLGVPVIPCTSKTRPEVESLRSALGNRHPFIVENGAAVFIPLGYFGRQPADTELLDGYWLRRFSPRRTRWLQLLDELAGQFPGEFIGFHSAGVDAIASMTGLAPAQAALADRREFSEPVRWLGDETRKHEFLAAARAAGANPLQGGRFITLAGDCDKGRALAWLREAYRMAGDVGQVRDIAIGDSGNDIAMLEAAQTALLIRSPVHDYPRVAREHDIIYSTGFGPQGWAEGVGQWLLAMGLPGAPA